MKKLIALVAFVAFIGGVAKAQTTDQKEPEKKETVTCTEAEKAKCEADAAKTGKKCETTATGSCCQKGGGTASNSSCSKGSGSSCCQKGGGTADANTGKAAKVKASKASKTAKPAKTTAAVAPEKK
jgi:hypothetical protein